MINRLQAGRLILSSLTVLAVGLVAVSAIHPARSAPAAAPMATVPAGKADPIVLASHRAIYDLKLSKSTGSRGIQAVRGRIVYDFSGNACDGYELNFCAPVRCSVQ